MHNRCLQSSCQTALTQTDDQKGKEIRSNGGEVDFAGLKFPTDETQNLTESKISPHHCCRFHKIGGPENLIEPADAEAGGGMGGGRLITQINHGRSMRRIVGRPITKPHEKYRNYDNAS
jgi:hypothetical protein